MALGSMGPGIVKDAGAERLAAAGDIQGAVQALLSRCTPIDDIRATAEYRMIVSRNILTRNLKQLLEMRI